jgi:hypothetical protein
VADWGAAFELSLGFVAGAGVGGGLAGCEAAEPDGGAVEFAVVPVPCDVGGLGAVAGAAGAGPGEVGFTSVQPNRTRKAGSPAIAICRIVRSPVSRQREYPL